VIEYTTKRGKILRGIVIRGKYVDAKRIDTYTFRHLDGWFIRERHVDQLADVAPVAPAPEPEWEAEPVSNPFAGERTLIAFLIAHGGVRDQHGDLRSMDTHRRRIGLVRVNGGMTLDHARETAEQAGYLPVGCGTNELIDAIADELHGRPVYPFMLAGTGRDNDACPF